jgi:hypothetical protein
MLPEAKFIEFMTKIMTNIGGNFLTYFNSLIACGPKGCYTNMLCTDLMRIIDPITFKFTNDA